MREESIIAHLMRAPRIAARDPGPQHRNSIARSGTNSLSSATCALKLFEEARLEQKQNARISRRLSQDFREFAQRLRHRAPPTTDRSSSAACMIAARGSLPAARRFQFFRQQPRPQEAGSAKRPPAGGQRCFVQPAQPLDCAPSVAAHRVLAHRAERCYVVAGDQERFGRTSRTPSPGQSRRCR